MTGISYFGVQIWPQRRKIIWQPGSIRDYARKFKLFFIIYSMLHFCKQLTACNFESELTKNENVSSRGDFICKVFPDSSRQNLSCPYFPHVCYCFSSSSSVLSNQAHKIALPQFSFHGYSTYYSTRTVQYCSSWLDGWVGGMESGTKVNFLSLITRKKEYLLK